MKVAMATVHMWPTDRGGKSLAIGNGGDYSCPIFFPQVEKLSAHGYDCRMLLGVIGKDIRPGETLHNVPIAFLSSNEVFSNIGVGTRFHVWEAKLVGEGEITGFLEIEG